MEAVNCSLQQIDLKKIFILLQIYLIDKGMQCEVSIDEIYEIPKEMLEFNVFGCICPVLVPSAEKLSAYKPLLGLKCRCEVGKSEKEVLE